MWGAIISAAVSAIGSYLGNKSDKKKNKAAQDAAKKDKHFLRKQFSDKGLTDASKLLFGDMFAPGAGVGPSSNVMVPSSALRGGFGLGAPGANGANPLANPIAGGPPLAGGSFASTATSPTTPDQTGPPPTPIPQPRAAGGPVQPGQPYLVGERGPELRIFDQPGFILPNPQTTPGMAIPGAYGPPGMPMAVPESPPPAGHFQQPSLRRHIAHGAAGAAAPPPVAGSQGSPPATGGHFRKPSNRRHVAHGMAGAQPAWLPATIGGGVQYRAQGGPVQPGVPTVVGEQGPEAAVPMPTPSQQTGVTVPAPPSKPRTTPLPTIDPGSPAVGAGTQTPGAPRDPTTGELASYWTNQFLMNPGQLSPIAYQRQQEQANIGLGNQLQALNSGLAAGGVDPNSPTGLALQQAAYRNNQLARQEAARDYALAKEGLHRQDISQGFNQYLTMLQALFNRQSARANYAGQTPPNLNAGSSQNMYGNLLSSLGAALASTNWGSGGGGGASTGSGKVI